MRNRKWTRTWQHRALRGNSLSSAGFLFQWVGASAVTSAMNTGRPFRARWRQSRPCWFQGVPTGWLMFIISPCSARSAGPSAEVCHTWAWSATPTPATQPLCSTDLPTCSSSAFCGLSWVAQEPRCRYFSPETGLRFSLRHWQRSSLDGRFSQYWSISSLRMAKSPAELLFRGTIPTGWRPLWRWPPG